MKKIFVNILFCCAAAFTLFSCSETYELFHLEESRLSFDYPRDQYGNADSIVRFTFVYHKADVVQDTVWVEMNTMGFLSDQDRSFALEQVEATLEDTYDGLQEGEALMNAESGKHYVPFDDEQLKKYLVVKAGQNKVRFPVLLKRDPSLLNGKYYLKFQLQPNDQFTGSLGVDRYFVIEVTEQFVKPEFWTTAVDYYWGGAYGPEKLKFLVNAAHWDLNDEWFKKNFSNDFSIDMGYTGYLSGYFTDKLVKLNQERAANGVGPLAEADGTIVQFCIFGAPTPYI